LQSFVHTSNTTTTIRSPIRQFFYNTRYALGHQHNRD
jgi:hypothetical protein